jgi:hypothetical protein
MAVSTGCTVHISSSAPLFKSTQTAIVDHVPGSPIDVQTENGSIHLAKAERADVEILATIQAETQQRADETEVVVERNEAGELVVRIEWPGGKRMGREACNLEIALPDAGGATLKSQNGEVTLSGLSGKAVLETHNGTVQVKEHDGDLQAVTHNGQVAIEGVTGSISVETDNGEIEITEAMAGLEARTRNGAVDISLAGEDAGPVTVESHNGAITLEVGDALSGKLQASTSNGAIEIVGIPADRVVERQKNRLTLQFDESETASSVETHSGAVTIRRSRPKAEAEAGRSTF